jgi:hypothetical protein
MYCTVSTDIAPDSTYLSIKIAEPHPHQLELLRHVVITISQHTTFIAGCNILLMCAPLKAECWTNSVLSFFYPGDPDPDVKTNNSNLLH